MKSATYLSLLAAVFVTAPALAQTPGFSNVVEFTGTTGARLGSEPGAAIMEHSDGNLYGTTLSGGRTGATATSGFGTVYKLTKAGVFTTITQFSGPTDMPAEAGDSRGFHPFCTLAENSDGFLFGTCSGLSSAQAGVTFAGYGNTFKVATSGVPSFFFAFSGQGQTNRGQKPIAGFVRVNSEFFGSTDGGGTLNAGTLFKVAAASGTNTYLIDFTATGASNRGSQPSARMINGGDGFLYGSTYAGGTGNVGTLFKYNLSTGVLTTLLEFTGQASPYPGKYPADALLLASDGNLYGTTANGGALNAGTVFRYNPSSNSFTTVVEFTDTTGNAQGAGPFGGLVQGPDGYLYGVTQYGGPQPGDHGTIFRLSLSGQLTPRLVDFSGTTGVHKGSQPYGGLMKTTQGIIYGTTLYGGTGNFGTIWKLDTSLLPSAPTVTTGSATAISSGGATLNGTINPNSLATTWQFEYGTTTAYGSAAPASPGALAAGNTAQPVNTTISGLSNNTTYHFRLRGTSTAGTTTGTDGTFTTGTGTPQGPLIVTGNATSVTASSATLNGTVNPQGSATTWQFEYGTTTSYGNVAPVPGGVTGTGTVAEAVSTGLTGLPGGTTIHFRLKGTNTGGTVTGSDQTFTTTGPAQPPVVVTGTATGITGTGAVLNGTVNPRGSVATWRFEYGTTLAFGSFAPVTPATIGDGIVPEAVNVPITGLTPGVTIFYRLTAQNEAVPGNTVLGTTGTFTTATPPEAVTQAAIAITNTGATLVGSVDPNGSETSWQFEYGPTTSYGTLIPVLPGTTGTGTSAEPVSFNLTGLAPGTTIHYRLRASNGAGSSTGADFTFTTKQAPGVTAAAQNVTATSATLSGTVNPYGAAATWQFDYGTTASYGTSVPATPGTTGSGSSPESVSFPLASLTPNTTYHFRLRATSANGTTTGPDVTFTTNNNISGWRQTHFGTMNNTGNAANTADPDKDGAVNLVEYAFGMNPNLPDQQLLPVPSYNGSTVLASFTSPAGVNDIIYGAETSTNLLNWSPVADGGSGRVHSFSSPVSPSGRNLMRLRVTLIP